MLTVKAASIIKDLNNKLVYPVHVDCGSAKYDTLIWITEDIHIQVGDDFVFVISNNNKGLKVFECEPHIDSIIENLVKAISG